MRDLAWARRNLITAFRGVPALLSLVAHARCRIHRRHGHFYLMVAKPDVNCLETSRTQRPVPMSDALLRFEEFSSQLSEVPSTPPPRRLFVIAAELGFCAA